ncbi:Bromodomain and PHD finger-containing protein 3 [Choanephora cucurbitarum]|uniref:Bromodomain and PHD finger-containing protein 3 n=1 Tax=Choanephora cucurbitarum TaxID=101091 RepID=A0A1C7NKV8_9FUNG|nr:Bromodomain and PHD finger-containing protein 3 [Choanephora cucurbitarum]
MSYSPELSPIAYSDEEDRSPTAPAPPTIKLKLKLNPYPSVEKKKKHKKKHKRKHKKSKEYAPEDSQEEEESEPARSHIGGKRPFALMQQQQYYQQDDDEDEEEDRPAAYNQEEDMDEESEESEQESYHPTDTKKAKHKHHNYDEPSETLPQPTATGRKLSKQGRRPSSTSKSLAPGEKPKKRGRPTNKAKAAALIAALPPKIPEQPKKDVKSVLTKLLDNIEKRDAYGLFLEPVNLDLVPDYLKVIKHPMDFSTMRKKIEDGTYTEADAFRSDFNLIVANAKLYNAADTIYWKSADKIYEVGSKLIDRAEKQIEEEKAQQAYYSEDIKRKDSISSRRLSMASGGSGRKDSLGIKEEDVDIMGIDTALPTLRKHSRQGSEIHSVRETSVDLSGSRAITPIRSVTAPYKKKKKKATDTGVLYGPDGSLHTVGGVSDLDTLIPRESSFADPPLLTTSNPAALPSAFFVNRNSTDDFFQNKHFVHSAHFCDYGPFTTLGGQPPGAFYTALDASYIYPLYGDDRGEAYMKSLWDFITEEDKVEETLLKETIEQKSNHLTRGAWSVVQQALDRRNENLQTKSTPTEYDTLNTEFGPVDAAKIVDKIEAKLQIKQSL